MRNSGKKDSTGRRGGGSKKSSKISGEEGEEDTDGRQSEEVEGEDGNITPTEDHLTHPLGTLSSTINALALEEKEREISEKEREVS